MHSTASGGERFATLVELLQYWADEQGERCAFRFLSSGDAVGSLTYRGLERRAQAIGAVLQEHGGPGERVLLLYPPGLEFIAAFFGCLFGGAIAVPLYPLQQPGSAERIKRIARDAETSIILTTAAQRGLVQKHMSSDLGLRHISCVATDDLVDPSDWQPPAVSAETIALLQYTSGSTSDPKGVIIDHGNLLHNLEIMRRAFGISLASHVVTWLPPYHDMGLIGGLLEPVYSGITVTVFSPLEFLRRPLSWLQAISRYRGTISGGPNFAYELCLRRCTPQALDGLDLSGWEVAFNGAEPIRAETLDRFSKKFAPYGLRREAFLPCYGLAEATLFVAGADRNAVPRLAHFDAAALEKNQVVPAGVHDDGMRSLVGCGRAWMGQKVVVADPESRRECKPGTIGEIWVQGESVSRGYWQAEVKTADTFHGYLEGSTQGPFLRTGDLGFVEDGELFLTGRLKDLIVIDGRNHYPQDIEQTMARSHPVIVPENCVALSVDIGDVERLVVMARIKPRHFGETPAEQALKQIETSVGRAIAEHHQIRPYRIVLTTTGSLPKTTSGKIKRFACRERFLQHHAPESDADRVVSSARNQPVQSRFNVREKR